MLSFIDVAHSSLYKTCQGHNTVNVKDTTRSMSRTQQGQGQGNNKVNVKDTTRSMSRTQQGQCQGHNKVNVKVSNVAKNALVPRNIVCKYEQTL